MTVVAQLSTAHSVTNIRMMGKVSRTLAKAGYEVVVLTPHPRTEVLNGVRVIGLPSAQNRLERMSYVTWRIYRECLLLPAEIYHFHMTELIPVGLLLRAHGKQVIYDVYEDMPRRVHVRTYLPTWMRSLIGHTLEGLEAFAARYLSAIVAATPTIAARFEALNPHTISVTNYPWRDELVPPHTLSWTQRPPTVAYIGGVEPNRGLYSMVEAMALVTAQPQATLKLAGPFLAEHQTVAATRAGWERVQIMGQLDRQAVGRMLSEAQVGIATLLPVPGHVESMPNKLFEYMAAGLPVIASDFPIWRGIVERAQCGLLVDPTDVAAIAHAIDYLLSHPAEAETMGHRGREAVVAHYNWEQESEKLLALYADLLAH